MKKFILFTISAFLITPLSFGKSSVPEEPKGYEKIKIKIEKVVPKEIHVHAPVTYPSSQIHRPLILPKDLINGEMQIDYHYFSSDHVGANMKLQGHYGWKDDWELNAETSLFPQTQKRVEFGGIRGGFLYRLLSEADETPEIALGAKIGFLGQGNYGLTQSNTISFYPQGLVKKLILERAVSLQGELLIGIGDSSSGIASLNTMATLKTTDAIDLSLKGNLQNLGYSSKEIFSLTPSLEYHLNPTWDISGGVQIGLLGADQLGNNFFVGVSSRL